MRVDNYIDIQRALTRAKATVVKYAKTANGVLTHAASDAATRRVLITVKVTETFANGNGAQPTFKIGEADTDDKFAATAIFTDAVKGDIFTLAGTITATKALIVTANDASGTTSGGAIKVTAVVFPVSQ
jgi:hypothetical protein